MEYYFSNAFRAPHKVWNPLKPKLDGHHPSFEELWESEYPAEFAECDHLARNRMVMGSFRYGQIGRQNLVKFDPSEEAIRRIRKYQKDGNLEHLVDANNIVKISYYVGKKYQSQGMFSIDDGEHAQPIQ